MVLLKAFEAESMSTGAVGGIICSIVGPINNLVVAALFWTPLEEPALICELLDMPL